MIATRALALFLGSVAVTGLTAACGHNKDVSLSAARTSAAPTSATAFPRAAVQKALQASLTSEPEDVYEASIPRDDLTITRGSVPVSPALDQDSELDFRPQPDGTSIVTGELASTAAEQVKLVPALLADGIDVSAVHNHLTNLKPAIQWVHFEVTGDPAAIATKIRQALHATTGTRFPVPEGKKSTTLPTDRLASILGGDPTVDDGVVQISINRGDQIKRGDVPIPSDLGVNAKTYFEPLPGGRAATTGEMCVLSAEVAPVIAALNKAGLTVTALHNHMLDTNPPTFFVHWFGTGSATALAGDLRAALDQANYPKKG